MKTFTEEQLDNWRAFEEVRSKGHWNMWFPQARKSTGLTEDEYSFVITNFDALKEAVEVANHSNWNTP